jgi:hypothetical protein
MKNRKEQIKTLVESAVLATAVPQTGFWDEVQEQLDKAEKASTPAIEPRLTRDE